MNGISPSGSEGFSPKDFAILYVDDERLALDLFRDNFGETFTVHTAGNAVEALEIVAHEDIALVLADQRMPGLSGTELFAELQKTRPEIIRILVTAYADLKAVVAAINAGHVYHYVEKPWDDGELRLTLKRALERVHLIRQRDRLQAQQIQTLEKMARTNRLAAVGTLAAGIAHEIRNPLSAILTFHQMLPEKLAQIRRAALEIGSESLLKPLLKEIDGDFWTRFAHLPLREVGRIKSLVQELLDFSRDSGSVYQMRSLDLTQLIEEILPILESDVRRMGVELRRDFEAELPRLEVAADRIKQVLINLLLNAMHATPEGGSITLRLRSREAEGCEIAVIDSGCGIDPENMEKVFDPFFTTRDPGSGTGLGLTMCHHIVAQHGGEISLQSEVGKGTQVTVRLPWTQDKRLSEASSALTLPTTPDHSPPISHGN